MSSAIYAFLNDEAFANVGSGSVVRYSDIVTSGVGMLDDNLLNYFNDHAVFLDPITDTEFMHSRRSRCTVDQVSAVAAKGRMTVHFDMDRVLDDEGEQSSTVLDAFQILDSDTTDSARQEKVMRRAALFNILDTVFMAHRATDMPCSRDEIDGMLSSNLNTSTTYYGYVSGSLNLSTTTTNAKYRMDSGSVSTEKAFWDGCSFDFEYESGKTCSFHVWLSAVAFKENYPFSTIVDIIYPCSPEWILNPSSPSQVEAVIAASEYKDTQLDTAVTERDHSGVAMCSSVYNVLNMDGLVLSFAVLYKGAAPSSRDMRQKIRDKLLNEINDNDALIGTEQQWRECLPDFFIESEFYLIPIFSQMGQVGGSTIEQTICPYRKIHTIASTVVDTLTPMEILERMEILQVPGHRMYIAAVPADLTSDITSVLAVHPTYQALDAIDETNAHWNTMTENTKDFARDLAKCLTACIQETTSSARGFTADTIGSMARKAYSFVDANSINYIMLRKSSSRDLP